MYREVIKYLGILKSRHGSNSFCNNRVQCQGANGGFSIFQPVLFVLF